MDLGKSDDAVADEQVEADVSGISLSAVGLLPIGPVDRFARMGAVDWEADLDSPSPDFSGSSDGTDMTYGLSAQPRVWGQSIRQDCGILDIEDADRIDRISVGVTWTLP